MKSKKTKQLKQTTNNKTKKVTGQLFSNNNPETTVHGYGFSNPNIAKKTIDDLQNRDIDYQLQVVNTMYHRGKIVANKTKNAETLKNINLALDIYNTWLNNYKSNKLNDKLKKPYLTPKQVSDLEFLAEYYDISHKARGLEKPTTSDEGFFVIWRRVKGDKKRLRTLPVKISVPDGQTWDKQRNNYLVRRLSMINNSKDALYYSSGKDAGLPTRLHVNMVMWAYSPDVKTVLSNINKYKTIINNNT